MLYGTVTRGSMPVPVCVLVLLSWGRGGERGGVLMGIACNVNVFHDMFVYLIVRTFLTGRGHQK
jgi:hypothetical protein